MPRPKLTVTPPPDDDGRKMGYQWESADTGRAVKPRYLLPSRIIGNGLCILEGDSSTGKSTFLAHLAGAITTGAKWLGRPKQPPQDVLWLTAEEDTRSMVRPRLVAAGVDLARVHWPAQDEAGSAKQLFFPASMGTLYEAVELYKLALIVIEPLVSYVGPEINLNQEAPARSVVDPLNQLAIRTGCTVIVTRGLRKDRSGPRSAHGSGHGTIFGAARSVLVIDRPDPTRDRRVLRTIKCLGAGAETPPLEYRLEREGDDPPRMVDLVDLVADVDPTSDLVPPGERAERRDARAMLRILCDTEYVPVKVIQAAADASGLGWRTVQNVKAELEIDSRPNHQHQPFFHEWGPPLKGWQDTPPITPVRSTPVRSIPKTRKKSRKVEEE